MRKGDVLGRKGITVNLSQLYYFRKLSELQHYTMPLRSFISRSLRYLTLFVLSRRNSAFRCFSARGAT